MSSDKVSIAASLFIIAGVIGFLSLFLTWVKTRVVFTTVGSYSGLDVLSGSSPAGGQWAAIILVVCWAIFVMEGIIFLQNPNKPLPYIIYGAILATFIATMTVIIVPGSWGMALFESAIAGIGAYVVLFAMIFTLIGVVLIENGTRSGERPPRTFW